MNKINISRRSFVGGATSLFALGAVSSLGLSACSESDDGYKMTKAKWIWLKNDKDEYDTYGEFVDSFKSPSLKDVRLEIACDGIYTVFINGKVAAFAQCSDFPNYKLYDSIDISKYCNPNSNNDIKIQVWHGPGKGVSIYKHDKAGVIFQVLNNNEPLIFSTKDTQCRKMTEFENGYMKTITPQMGYSYKYDSAIKNINYTNSEEISKNSSLHLREIAQLQMGDLRLAKFIKETQNSLIYDLGEETSGFLTFDLSCKAQQLTIAYGEHLADGVVRQNIGSRDFSVEYIARDGQNVYQNTFRRLAGRFLELKYESEKPNVNSIGLAPVIYPVKMKDFKLKDQELQKIYDASVLTLKSCMHEHYEDCPWREQALYGMDGRNQMLCGYYAFEGHEYQKHNLILLSKSLRSDGLLEICAPSDTEKPIVFFSMCFILAVYEYIMHTNDKSILDIVGASADTIMKTLSNNIRNGLISAFQDPPFWNFFEWTDESDGMEDANVHLMQNCMFCYVHELYEEITGKSFADVDKLRENIKKQFYVNGKYVLHDQTDRDSQLGNALVLLAKVDGQDLANKLVADLIECWTKPCGSMIKASLSMKAFVYDAVLNFGDANKKIVLQDIRYTFSKMINDKYFSGTFWETEEGQSAFDNAGSLCHGWSAIAAYYLPKYFSNN